MQSTLHIADAIAGGSRPDPNDPDNPDKTVEIPGRPPLLHWVGKCDFDEFENRGSRGWYQGIPDCTKDDKEQYERNHPSTNPQCDEYPPYAVAEGGKSGDAALKELIGVGVSLRYVDAKANESCGSLLRWFTINCDVGAGEPFAVQMDVTESKSNITRGKWENGEPCYHPEGFVNP